MMGRLWRLPPEEYKGHSIRTAPGLHAAAADMLLRHATASASLLDIAAGTGAWLARMRDAGLTDLAAIEIDTNRFRVEGVKPVAVDLNHDFSSAFDRRFDVITAIEIIEHLDNPRHFVRNLRSLLNDRGLFLVTTPNIGHWAGRIRFLLSGEMRYFRAGDYHGQRHISPISHLHMQLLLEEIGFELLASRTVGGFFGPAKVVLTAPVSFAMRLLMGPRVYGDASIYLARKKDASTDSPGRSSYYFKHEA